MKYLRKARARALLLTSGVLGLAGSARAAAPEADHGVDASTDPGALGNHQKHIRLDLGARTQFIKSKGFDPFSERDALTQVSASASWAFWSQDAVSLAAVAGFDYGYSSADARSSRASLRLARFVLAPEARYHVLRVLALTAKVGPTLTREAAELDSGLATPLTKASWRLGVDATAGVAVELYGYASGSVRRPRFWFTAEGGYGWTAPMKLDLKPENSAVAPERLVAPPLSDLSVSGPLARATLALSFW